MQIMGQLLMNESRYAGLSLFLQSLGFSAGGSPLAFLRLRSPSNFLAGVFLALASLASSSGFDNEGAKALMGDRHFLGSL